MTLRRVAQENHTGCFVAGVAMILGKSYQDTFRILHPGKDPSIEYSHGFSHLSVQEAAFQALKLAGIKGHSSSLKRFSSYRKKDSHALLIIRWSWSPTQCHTIVYDGDDHKFLDPAYGDEIKSPRTLRHLQEQLDCAIIIDSIPTETTHDLPRDDSANRAEGREDGLGQQQVSSDGPTPLLTTP